MSEHALTLEEIARRLNARLVGDGGRRVGRVSSLDHASADSISFISEPRYRERLRETAAGAVLARAEFVDDIPGNAVIVDNPYAAYARVAAWLHPLPPLRPGVHASAVVAASATVEASTEVAAQVVIGEGSRIGADCYIGPGCVIGRDVEIGPGCRLLARVCVLDRCVLGRAVRVQPGAVIGSEGFGFARDGQEWLPIPHQGRVVIGDSVEIGANTTIDRGSLEDTVIGNGVILDNLIQIAHNVRIGDRTAMAGCVGVAGSAHIGRDCTIGGAANILGHLEIADQVHITATSLVTGSITEAGKYSSGTLLEPNSSWRRNMIRIRQLDRIARRLDAIEKKLKHQS